jgi:hypothetical protein
VACLECNGDRCVGYAVPLSHYYCSPSPLYYSSMAVPSPPVVLSTYIRSVVLSSTYTLQGMGVVPGGGGIMVGVVSVVVGTIARKFLAVFQALLRIST